MDKIDKAIREAQKANRSQIDAAILAGLKRGRSTKAPIDKAFAIRLGLAAAGFRIVRIQKTLK